MPRFLQRDRDCAYGWAFRRKVKALGIDELISAPRSPWQNAFAERVIGSIRRECTDHVIPMGEKHLLRTLRDYVEYYNEARTHQSLGGNSPIAGQVEAKGEVVVEPVLGGLHHRYSRAESVGHDKLHRGDQQGRRCILRLQWLASILLH